MDATREVVKFGQRSVVEVICNNKIAKYVTCTDYDPQKSVGSQWYWGHYYDIINRNSEEERQRKLRLAILDLYNIDCEKIPAS